MQIGLHKAAGLKCPECATLILWKEIRFGDSFRCSACRSRVCVPRWYLYLQTAPTLLLASCFAYLLGAHGMVLVVIIAATFFPAAMLVAFVTQRVVPPTLRLSEDYRETLFGSDGE
jgi:hypothetical protein